MPPRPADRGDGDHADRPGRRRRPRRRRSAGWWSTTRARPRRTSSRSAPAWSRRLAAQAPAGPPQRDRSPATTIRRVSDVDELVGHRVVATDPRGGPRRHRGDRGRRRAGPGRRARRVKMVGTGHSFTAISAPEAHHAAPDQPAPASSSVDRDAMTVTALAGTQLKDAQRRARARSGCSLHNMGDIDEQTLAGATSTGTHGTGGVVGRRCRRRSPASSWSPAPARCVRATRDREPRAPRVRPARPRRARRAHHDHLPGRAALRARGRTRRR